MSTSEKKVDPADVTKKINAYIKQLERIRQLVRKARALCNSLAYTCLIAEKGPRHGEGRPIDHMPQLWQQFFNNQDCEFLLKHDVVFEQSLGVHLIQEEENVQCMTQEGEEKRCQIL